MPAGRHTGTNWSRTGHGGSTASLSSPSPSSPSQPSAMTGSPWPPSETPRVRSARHVFTWTVRARRCRGPRRSLRPRPPPVTGGWPHRLGRWPKLPPPKLSLGNASLTGYLQSVNITSLNSCLSGVSGAVDAIALANLQGAVNSITAASSACLALDGSSTGISYPFDFPDPFVLPVGGEYYAFATNSAAGNIQIIQSSDLTHWTTIGDALPHLAIWAQPGATWAPSVLRRGSNYVMYYSADFGATGEQCLSEAVATQPQGPYVDSSTWPLECQLDLGGSLDPSPWVEADGTAYLTWKSEGSTVGPPTLWSQQLTRDGTGLVAGAPLRLVDPQPELARRGHRGSGHGGSGRAAPPSSTRPTTGRPPNTPSGWPAAVGRSDRARKPPTGRCSPRSQGSAGPVGPRSSPTARAVSGWPSMHGFPERSAHRTAGCSSSARSPCREVRSSPARELGEHSAREIRAGLLQRESPPHWPDLLTIDDDCDNTFRSGAEGVVDPRRAKASADDAERLGDFRRPNASTLSERRQHAESTSGAHGPLGFHRRGVVHHAGGRCGFARQIMVLEFRSVGGGARFQLWPPGVQHHLVGDQCRRQLRCHH